MNEEAFVAANRAAWDRVAEKFAPDVERDVELLRGGGSTLFPEEIELLAPLLPTCRRAIHLQCSHGMDALSLWSHGAREVVGVDFSEAMLVLARRKSERLGAAAAWHRADVLAPPAELDGTADLVYTGKGALCWVIDLSRWAGVVARLLAPGGHFFAFEGHPLNALWKLEVPDLELRDDADYFANEPRANLDFPHEFNARTARPGESPKQAFERQWTLGEIVTALADAGLRLIRLREYPHDFWPQLRLVPEERARRVPHTFSLLMQRGA